MLDEQRYWRCRKRRRKVRSKNFYFKKHR